MPTVSAYFALRAYGYAPAYAWDNAMWINTVACSTEHAVQMLHVYYAHKA